MPELPEVETVRRTLARAALGRVVESADVRRTDVVRGAVSDTALLVGRRITGVVRHGKQLAVVAGGLGADASCVCVHLGMSGSLRVGNGTTTHDAHSHVVWQLDGGRSVVFRDPRRFGGVWLFPSEADLHATRWSALGPDALQIRPTDLHQRLQRTRRAIKAALLDQSVVAGLGNIYVDELLFQIGVHPERPADTIGLRETQRLVRVMRQLLTKAIAAGGSTLRDYTDADGRSGRFQQAHLVYGRAGAPCRQCDTQLEAVTLASRTTVFCPRCQGLSSTT